MSTHDPDDEFVDDHDSLDALDFDTPEIVDDASSGLDALPEYIPDADLAHALDAVHHYADHGAVDDVDDGFGVVGNASDEDDEQIPVVHAVNPPGTVSVTAYLNGSVAHVDLDPKVTTLTEAQLADEIRFVAGVAATKATAVVHVGVVNMMVEQGVELNAARDFVATNMPFSTPAQADEAELALIARHHPDRD